MRALLLDFPDDERAMISTPDRQNYEFMFGDDLLIAPVVREGETERAVYLPKGIWYNFWTDERYAGPLNLKVSAPIDHIPIFVRGGAIIPARQAVEYVGQAPINPLIFEIYPKDDSSREYYEDDGISFEYRRGVFLRKRISISQHENGIRLEISSPEGSYIPPPRSLVFKIHGWEFLPKSIRLGNEIMEILPSTAALDKTATGAAYDAETQILWLKAPDQNGYPTIDIRK